MVLARGWVRLGLASTAVALTYMSLLIKSDRNETNNNVCDEGPYLFDVIVDNAKSQGIGVVSRLAVMSAAVAKTLLLKYIMADEWWISGHQSQYAQLFDFSENGTCRTEHIMQAEKFGLNLVNITTRRKPPDPLMARLDVTILRTICDLMKGHTLFPDEQNVLQIIKRHGPDQESYYRQFYDTWKLRGKKTVFMFHRKFEHVFGEPSYSHTADVLCGTDVGSVLFSKAFQSQRQIDIRSRKPRFVPSDRHLEIVFHFRWGDEAETIENLPERLAKEGLGAPIRVLKNLFGHPQSVLNGFNGYRIWFLSEFRYKLGSPPAAVEVPPLRQVGMNIRRDSPFWDFKNITTAFPGQDKLLLRLNSSEHLEDMDIAANADIFISPSMRSTFTTFLARLTRKEALKILNTEKALHDQHTLELKSLLDLTSENVALFNMIFCDGARISQIVSLCKDRSFPKFRHLGEEEKRFIRSRREPGSPIRLLAVFLVLSFLIVLLFLRKTFLCKDKETKKT